MGKDGCKVQLSVIDAMDAEEETLPTFKPKYLEFIAGDGAVCDAIELAVRHMRKGEWCKLYVPTPGLVAEEQLGLANVTDENVILHMKLDEFEKLKELHDLTPEKRVEYASKRKERGGELFKAGRFGLALERYRTVTECFPDTDQMEGEVKAWAIELTKLGELDKALCFLKLKEYKDVKCACNSVLKDDQDNVKAVFRRAQAHFGLKDFEECISDCNRVLELEAENTEARVLLRQATTGKKQDDTRAKNTFAKMFSAG